MPLSCEYDDYGDADYFAAPDEDFSQMPLDTKGHCCSCGKNLSSGDTVLRHKCWRPPTEEEVDLYYDEEREGGYDENDEVPLPDEYLCERCGEIRMNLEAAGYVCLLGERMSALLAEYQDMTGFDPTKYKAGESIAAVQNG